MTKAEARIAQLFAAAQADGCTADTATARVLDRMSAAPAGRWRAQRVQFPENMARQLLVYVEAIDATASKWRRWAHQGRVAPPPYPFPTHDEALTLATSLHAGRPVEIGSVLSVYRLWKRATALPCYRAGDPSFLAGWRQPPRRGGADTQPRRPTVDVDWSEFVFTWNDFKDKPEEDDGAAVDLE